MTEISYRETTTAIAFAGSADSGKSTTISAIVYNKLDDGNGGKTGFPGSVAFTVYDYNLKEVYSGTQTGNLSWNGFNGNGQRLKSGLYYIRLIETQTDSSTRSNIIKILIK